VLPAWSAIDESCLAFLPGHFPAVLPAPDPTSLLQQFPSSSERLNPASTMLPGPRGFGLAWSSS
jgi:hypothetical protein